MNTNWTTFTKRIFIKAPADNIYEAWATSGRISEWFLEKAGYHEKDGKLRGLEEHFREGDHFEWKWNNWDFTEKGNILRANGKDGISFTFGSGGIVHVDLKSHGQQTEVILRQEEIPTDEKSRHDIYVGCATGWTFWLTNLKAWLEHGITLHATGLPQEETTNLVNS